MVPLKAPGLLVIDRYQVIAVILPVKRHRRYDLISLLGKALAQHVTVRDLQSAALLDAAPDVVQEKNALPVHLLVVGIKCPVLIAFREICREHLDDLLTQVRIDEGRCAYRINNESCLVYKDLVLKLGSPVFLAFRIDPVAVFCLSGFLYIFVDLADVGIDGFALESSTGILLEI